MADFAHDPRRFVAALAEERARAAAVEQHAAEALAVVISQAEALTAADQATLALLERCHAAEQRADQLAGVLAEAYWTCEDDDLVQRITAALGGIPKPAALGEVTG